MNFESTYKENYPKLFRIASKMVNDEDVASDIVQEIFVCFFVKLQKGDAILHPQSWLARAVINKCIDCVKRNERETPLNALIEPESEDKSFETKQNTIILKQAIAVLKPMEMKIIMLYSEGYSYKEIAQITEINFSSIGKTLSRTLQKLKLILKRMNYEMY